MATVVSPTSLGFDVITINVDMRNAQVAVDRYDSALAGLLMTDAGAVLALYVAFSVRAENAKDHQLKALYEPIAARYLQRFNELLRSRKVDPVFQQPIEVLKKKFLAIYPLGRS